MSVAPYGNDFYNSQIQKPQITKDGFEYLVDCKFFAPEEISVKVNNNIVSIFAQHEERAPGYPIKYIRRKVDQHFNLPAGFSADNLVSGLSPEGILSIRCRASPNTPQYTPIQY
ncbi:heat shock protein beta-6-like [Contarinia nasturtii]|uniref:heat shock protein beta-6-like n=1 Tax=Contarinia nasturtii TaxID=265458 RepID=UPI0012D3A538|nr:heat shock protein beta-6-like [Contarinia nasturtii]